MGCNVCPKLGSGFGGSEGGCEHLRCKASGGVGTLAPGAHRVEGGFWVIDDKFEASRLERGEVVGRNEADDLEDDIGGGVEAGHLMGG